MPIYTNKYGIPEPFVNVVMFDPRGPRRGDISVTELIKPPQMLELERQHDHQITIDVSDLLWALDGKLAHEALKHARVDNALQEERFDVKVLGWTVTGGPDLYQERDNMGRECVVTDWKRTSVWMIVYRRQIAQWTAQLNLYALLFERAGFPVNHLQITAMLRDWDADKAEADAAEGGNYPRSPVLNIPIDMWAEDVRMKYLQTRLRVHKAARLKHRWPPCSPADRWHQGAKWAVCNRKNKKSPKTGLIYASSLHDTPKEARETLARYVESGKPRKDMFVDPRPGVNLRCARYCDVGRNGFCPQLQAERGMRIAS